MITCLQTEKQCFNTFQLSVDCVWGEWTTGSKCSTTCGDGNQQMNRRVKTIAKHGGKDCEGDATKVGSCNLLPCPGN